MKLRFIGALGFVVILSTASRAAENGAIQSGLSDDDPADVTLWPNRLSRANSDQWLVKNHDSIRQMRPRVLAINFSNEASGEHLKMLLNDLFAALKESSRYHGYEDSPA